MIVFVQSRPIARIVLEGLSGSSGADLEDQALAALGHDTRRSYLDLDRNDLTGLKLLQLVVGVERAPRLRALHIEFAM